MTSLSWINSPTDIDSATTIEAIQTATVEDLSVKPLRGIPELLTSLGSDFDAVARRAGECPAALDDPEGHMSFLDVQRLLHECEQATGCPHFGVLLGSRMGISATGILGDLARHATSVLQSLRTIQAHLHLHDRGAVLGLHQRNHREMEIAYVIFHPEHPGSRHIAEGTLAIAMSVLRALCGPRWAPTEVMLARDRPADTAAYRDCFGPDLRFNAPRFAVVFDSGWLSRALPAGDAMERIRLARRVTELERSRRPSTSERARESLTQLLIEAPPSVDRVARLLGVSVRTLNRRLAREGTSFKALLEDARSSLARQLLRDTRLPAIEIAAALHYTTPSAFSRAFRGWNRGMSPRRARQAGPTGPGAGIDG
jgi:AraC-like DNA-binding protein